VFCRRKFYSLLLPVAVFTSRQEYYFNPLSPGLQGRFYMAALKLSPRRDFFIDFFFSLQ